MFMSMMHIMYAFTIIQTVVISVSSSNWLIVWMMMEVNLMMFIPFICSKKYLTDVSPSVKYFLAQVMGSLLLIFFVVFNLIKNFNSSVSSSSYSIMLMAMAIKSGTPPFHFWFPQLMEMSNWIQMTSLLTIQKIIPLIFLFYSMNFIYSLIVTASGLVGALGAFNQNSLKKIIAYSSMTHMGWVMLAMMASMKLSLVYFTVYSFMIYVLLYLLKHSSMSLSNLMASNMFNSKALNLSVCVMLLAISGIPPFSGFIIKMMVIYSAMNNLILSAIMVTFSLISMVYYIRVIYFFILSKSMSLKMTSEAYILNSTFALTVAALNILFPLVTLFAW